MEMGKIDQLEVTSQGNKNKTGQSLGQSNLENSSSRQGSNLNIQHVTNGQQHTLYSFLGNKMEQGPNWVVCCILWILQLAVITTTTTKILLI